MTQLEAYKTSKHVQNIHIHRTKLTKNINFTLISFFHNTGNYMAQFPQFKEHTYFFIFSSFMEDIPYNTLYMIIYIIYTHIETILHENTISLNF